VKHCGDESSSLEAWLAAVGVALPTRQLNTMLMFLDGLISVNQDVNLTRITDPEVAVRLHILDSLVALPEVHDAPSGVMIDLGSGGGFPGVPLAIASGRETVLLDSVRKKGAAVRAVLGRIHPDVGITVISERAEEHAQSHAGGYAVVVARAVAPLPVLLELASPLLAAGGRLVALKGNPTEAELNSGRVAAELVGFGSVVLRKLDLPGGGERRTIVSATKVGESSVRLPRRNGMAQKTPLA
jgi:16S rRNA (guanine527-N7)-methyltransferase